MTEPKDVLEAMAKELCSIASFTEYDDERDNVKRSFRDDVRRILRAARELGWKMVPREVDDNMHNAALQALHSDKWQWKPQYDAAPDLVGE